MISSDDFIDCEPFPFFRLKIFKCDRPHKVYVCTDIVTQFLSLPMISTALEAHKHISLTSSLSLLLIFLSFILTFAPSFDWMCSAFWMQKKNFIRNSALVTSHNLSERRYANVVRWCMHWTLCQQCAMNANLALPTACIIMDETTKRGCHLWKWKIKSEIKGNENNVNGVPDKGYNKKNDDTIKFVVRLKIKMRPQTHINVMTELCIKKIRN